MYTIELPLYVERWQADILNKRFSILCSLYNEVQSKLLRQYIYFSQFDEYQKILKEQKKRAEEKKVKIKEEKKSKEKGKAKKKGKKEKEISITRLKKDFWASHPFTFKGIDSKDGSSMPITFQERSICAYVEKYTNRHTDTGKTYGDLGLNTSILCNLGAAIWKSWEKRLYDPECTHIHFKKRNEVNSITTNHRVGGSGKHVLTGFKFDTQKMMLHYNINGRQGQYANFLSMPIIYNDHNENSMEYEATALSNGIENFRNIRIVRRRIRGKYKYYFQLCIDGKKFFKGRKLGKGRVAIDLGLTKITIYTEKGVYIKPFTPTSSYYEEGDRELRRVKRQIDRSRRIMNPDNFEEDGRCKKGRKKWLDSNRYHVLSDREKEIQRMQAVQRRIGHINLANELLSLGDYFVIEDNKVKEWAARKRAEKRSKKSGKLLSQAGFGKFIGKHAPATFVSILEHKVTELGGTFVKVDCKNRATDYDFTDDSYHDHNLEERFIITSDNKKHHRDTIAAFNLYHLDDTKEEPGHYQRKDMQKHYDKFCRMEKDALQAYKDILAVL